MYRQVVVSGFPAIALRSAEIEVVVVPAIGMRVTNLRRPRGREWLWRNDQISLASPGPGAPHSESADFGGWDECFPTVAASPVPGAPSVHPPIPEHGELWSASWASSAYEHAAGTTLTSSMEGTVFPYQFQREITLDPSAPVLRLRYILRHLGDAPFPWIWSAYPLLNVQPGSRLTLPTVDQMRVSRVHGRDDLRRDMIVDWAGGLGGEGKSLTLPGESRWALKLFGDVGRSGRMILRDPRRGERLELIVDPMEVPQIGVWINSGGWAPPGRTPYYNIALQPCIGAPDQLADAVQESGTARMLAPGEECRWEVEVRLHEEDGGVGEGGGD
jgi:galactose mutarotase-like enzyme